MIQIKNPFGLVLPIHVPTVLMAEGSVYGSCAIRKFMGLNFHDERTPEATMEKNGESSEALSAVWRSFGSL